MGSRDLDHVDTDCHTRRNRRSTISDAVTSRRSDSDRQHARHGRTTHSWRSWLAVFAVGLWLGLSLFIGMTLFLMLEDDLDPSRTIFAILLWGSLAWSLLLMAQTSATLSKDRLVIRNGPFKHFVTPGDITRFEWRYLPLVAWQPVIHVVAGGDKVHPILASASLSPRRLVDRWAQLHQWQENTGEPVNRGGFQQVGVPVGLSSVFTLALVVVLVFTFIHDFLPLVAWMIGVGTACFMRLVSSRGGRVCEVPRCGSFSLRYSPKPRSLI